MADKGLKSNVVGLFGGTMLGISSVAPQKVNIEPESPAMNAESVRRAALNHESAHAMRPHEHLVS